jgi:alpha-2-macroglobulin
VHCAQGRVLIALQVTNDYQWLNADGHWSYEPVKSSKRIASGTIDIGADARAKFSGHVGWGAHRLDVKTLDGEKTSVAFDVGWSGTAGANTPDNVVVTLDKTNYTAGEEAKLRIASAFTGKATIALVGDKIERFIYVDLVSGDNVVPFAVGADWDPGAYAVALTPRPLDVGAKRMPGRTVGVAWFAIDRASHALVSVSGAPIEPDPAVARGYAIERSFYKLDRTKLDACLKRRPTLSRKERRRSSLLPRGEGGAKRWMRVVPTGEGAV